MNLIKSIKKLFKRLNKKEDNMYQTYHVNDLAEVKTYFNEVCKNPKIKGYRCVGGGAASYGYDPDKKIIVKKMGEFYFDNPSYKEEAVEDVAPEIVEDKEFDVPEVEEAVETQTETQTETESPIETETEPEAVTETVAEVDRVAELEQEIKELNNVIDGLEEDNKSLAEQLAAKDEALQVAIQELKVIKGAAKIIKDMFNSL